MGAREQALLVQQLLAVRRPVRAALVEWIRRWFAASESFRDADRDRFVEQFTPIALGAQQTSALTMWTFQDQMLADITGDTRSAEPPDVSTVTGEALRGVPPETVYARPFAEIWRVLAEHEADRQELLEEARAAGEPVDEVEARLAEEKPLTKAVAAGERRARLLGVTDLELAEREAARQILTTDARAPRFYQRVLTGDENCGLCIVASTQRYRREELLPIHPGCDCVVQSLPDGTRHVIDEQLLESAHLAIKERFGIADRSARVIDYRKILLVREHGELGPVLTVARHKFTAADDLPDHVRESLREDDDPNQLDVFDQPEPEPLPDVTTWTDEQLEAGVGDYAHDEALLDAILGELDRRAAEPPADEGQADAEDLTVADERDAEKWARYDELVASGMSEQDAYAEAFDLDPDRVRREEAIARLRGQDYHGRGFDELARNAYRDALQADYFAAETATNGYLLNAEGQRRGLDPLDLWRQNEAYARRWASDELKEWWDANGRLTFDVFAARLLSGGNERRFRTGGESWLQ